MDAPDPQSDPRVKVDRFVVYPTGYDDLVHADKYHWCFTVVDGHEWGWSIRQGRGDSFYAMNRKGEFIGERRGSGANRFRRYTLEEALRLALKYVDTYKVMGLTAREASDEIARRIAEREKDG